MKRLFAIGLFLITILALSVSATKSVELSTISTITEKPSVDFQTTFTIKNTGDENLTLNIELVDGLSNFNINFFPSIDIFIENGTTSAPITVNGTVYRKVETTRTGTVDGTTFSGTINVKSGTTTVSGGSTRLNIIAESALKFKKIKADGNSLDYDKNTDEIKPGDTVKFTGEIENLYDDSDDEDIDLEDVEITITIEGIDDEGSEDVDDSEDVGDINPEEEESFSIEFKIPEDIEAEKYEVIITVEGEDENGATHYIEWTELTLEVEKDRNDIWITKASASPSKVSCSRDIDINIELKNQGEKDEDDVVLRIESSALGIDFEDISIPELESGAYDEDTEYKKTYPFTVDDKVKAGTYTITLKAYYNTDTLSDTENIDLIVEKCATEEDEEEEDVIVVTPPPEGDEDEEEPEIITTPYTELTEGGLLSSNTYMILLTGAIVVAVIVILVMFAILLKMKKTV